MNLRFTLALVCACCTVPQARPAGAQQLPATPLPQAPAPQVTEAPAPHPALPPALSESVPVSKRPAPSTIPGLAAYESCTFSDGLTMQDRTPLYAGVTTRAAETSHGTVAVQAEAGERVLFAYPAQDVFANVKLEKLPARDYLGQKRTLIEDFNHTLAQSPLGARNYSLPVHLRGFEIYGLDRVELSGSVLGIYLFFDDLNRIATTIFFLNQDATTRPFQTTDQYAALRDKFLKSYTACIRTHQGIRVTP